MDSVKINKTIVWEVVSDKEKYSITSFNELMKDMGLIYDFNNLAKDKDSTTFTFNILDIKRFQLARIKYAI
jgi:hypothetical protein